MRRKPPDSIDECRDDDELAQYLWRVYGIDPGTLTLDYLRNHSVPAASIDELVEISDTTDSL